MIYNLARRILIGRPMDAGELPRIAKDIHATAWVADSETLEPEARLFGRYVTAPTARKTYDTDVERAVAEDRALMKLLVSSAGTLASPYRYGRRFDYQDFSALRTALDKRRMLLRALVVPRALLSDLVMMLSDKIDPMTKREFLLQGVIGALDGVKILTQHTALPEEVVPAVFGVADPEYLGEFHWYKDWNEEDRTMRFGMILPCPHAVVMAVRE